MALTRPLLPLFICTCWLSLAAFGAQIRGVVSDNEGQPLAQIPIRLWEKADYYSDGVPTELQTDAKGTFVFETKQALDEREGHSLTAVIMVPGLASAAKALKEGDNEIRLRPAKSWGGVVLDSEQKPIAGATIRVSQWSQGKEVSAFPEEQALQAVSDAQGRYLLPNVPILGEASLQVRGAGLESSTFQVNLAPAEAPPLFLKPGASVKGRLLTAEGQPLDGVRLYTSGDFDMSRRTAPDGTFSLDGIKPGQVPLYAIPKKGDVWIIKPLQVEGLKAGETRSLPDWVAARGVEVSGQVVDATTQKPLSGFTVQIYSSASAIATTDATGHFKIYSLEAIAAEVSGAGYRHKSLYGISIPKDATQYDLGTITMERSASIKGTARDEKVEKVAYFKLKLKSNTNDEEQIYGQEGEFTSEDIAPGTYSLTADDFEVVSPKTVTLKLGQPLTNVEVVLRNKSATPRLPLRGRVVDSEGKAIAGAAVTYKFDQYNSTTLISGVDGRFQLEKAPFNQKPIFESLERPGFVFSSGGEVTQVETEWQSTLLMAPAGQIFKGRVVDAQDQPVAGAWVAVLGDKKRDPIPTDETGSFTLRDLPSSEISLGAAQGMRYTSIKLRGDDQNTVLKLAPPAEVDAKATAEAILQTNPKISIRYLTDYQDILGDERLENHALRADGALDGEGKPIAGKAGASMRALFAHWENYNPQRLTQRGSQLIPIFKEGNDKAAAEGTLARVLALSDDLEARQQAKTWLDREKTSKREITADTVTQYLNMAVVANRLKLNEADSWFDFAMTIAAQLSDKVKYNSAYSWGVAASKLEPRFIDQVLEELKAPQAMALLNGAVRDTARRGEIENASRLLEQMKKLETDPQVVAAKNQEGWLKDSYFSASDLMTNATSEVAKELVKSDPEAAWKLAEGISDDYRLYNLLPLANGARLKGKNEVARQALNAIFNSPWVGTEYLARGAAVANLMDANWGAELFDKARARTKPSGPDRGDVPSIAAWTFYHAPLDKGLSRVLLESEWSWRLPAFKSEKTDNDFSSNGMAIEQLAWAMILFDPKRALEWLEFAPNQWNARDNEKARMVAVLLATPEQRATFDIDNR